MFYDSGSMKYVVGNWKMAPQDRRKAETLAQSLVQELRARPPRVSVVVCPPFVWLSLARDIMTFSEFCALGAQDVFFKPQGPYTGEISAPMLQSLGVSHVLIGHSERRGLGETNTLVAEKLAMAVAAGLTPILCVGETSREGDWYAFLREQVETAFAALQPRDAERLIVAYEPVWAIGSDTPDTPDSALTAAIFIRKFARERFGDRLAERMPVLYGGAVLQETVGPFAMQEGIDGVLVGRASLDAAVFGAMVRRFGET